MFSIYNVSPSLYMHIIFDTAIESKCKYGCRVLGITVILNLMSILESLTNVNYFDVMLHLRCNYVQ